MTCLHHSCLEMQRILETGLKLSPITIISCPQMSQLEMQRILETGLKPSFKVLAALKLSLEMQRILETGLKPRPHRAQT